MFQRKIIFYPVLFLIHFFILSGPIYAMPPDNNQNGPLAIIVDTDMGLDDIRALMALLADSAIDICAILTVEGSAALGKGTDNLIGFLETYHSESIPVIKGHPNAALKPPEWRTIANDLGGKKFPPPRRMSARELSAEVFHDLLRNKFNIDCVALGPLGNLVMVQLEYPKIFKHIKKLWIPASIENDKLESWNFYSDIGSAEQVFFSVPDIEIIQIPKISPEETRKFISSLNGDSHSVQWIKATIAKNKQNSDHCKLYDDIAATAMIDKNLLNRSDKKYRVTLNDQKRFELKPDTTGNVRIAQINNISAALAVLKNRWQKDTIEQQTHGAQDRIPVRDLLRAFHGHLGPYVVIGYRMGKLALNELHSDGHFGLTAEVHSILAPPFSCLVDGVQLGSGCTLGKRNIDIREHKDSGWAVFYSENGDKTTIRLREDIPPLITKYVNEKGVEFAGELMMNMETDKLFFVE